MSVRKKILIPMAVVAVVCAAVIGSLGVLVVRMFVKDFRIEQLSRAKVTATAILENYISNTKHASAVATEDGRLAEAVYQCIETGDRQPLVELASNIMQSAGMDVLTVTDATGTVLARAHNESVYGDSIALQGTVRNALRGRQYASLEEARGVSLSALCGAPIYDANHTLVGVLCLGYRLSQNTYVDYIKHLTNTEVSIFLGDTRISTTVLNENGERATGTKLNSDLGRRVLNGEEYTGRVTVQGKELMAEYSPLRNAEGQILGMIFVGLDTSAWDERMTMDTFIMMGVVALLGMLSLFVSRSIAARLSRPIIAISKGARQLAQGDLDIELGSVNSTSAEDEVGILAREFGEMAKTIERQAQVLSAIASGDFSISIPVRSEKDVMNKAINRLIDKNNGMLAEVNSSAAQVSSGSRQIADGAHSLARGSSRQAEAVERLSATISEIADKTKENATIAREASNLSNKIKDNAQKGNAQMARLMQAVREIGNTSGQIESVNKVIDDISFQTNILALNAAVEAARAGMHGHGFAVVAQEVRSLAAKSAEAAKRTAELLESSIEKAGLGIKLATQTSDSLTGIVNDINRSTEIAARIAQSSDEQVCAIDQVNIGIEQVNQVVHHNNATAQESAAASEEMSGQSELLAQLMMQFKLRGEEDAADVPTDHNPMLVRQR